HHDLLAWRWQGAGRHVVVVNLSARPAQARVQLPWDDLGGKQWELSEILSETTYERDGDELTGSGLFVALDGWQWHLVSMHQKVAAAPQPELVEVRAGGDRAGRAKGLAAETGADDGLDFTQRR